MPPTFTVERPIDPTALAVIRAVWGASVALGLEPLLVGATTRILLLEHVFTKPFHAAPQRTGGGTVPGLAAGP